MLDNLFDWEYPDDKTNNCIKEYGKTIYEKEKRKTFWFSYLSLIVLEYFPLSFAIAFKCTENISPVYSPKDFWASATICILILVFIVIYYIYKICSKKRILSDINANKVKILSTLVRGKKISLGKHIISVRLQGDNSVDYRVDRKTFKNLKKGSAVLAIKYENKKGFNDKYDFILNPNTILEEE